MRAVSGVIVMEWFAGPTPVHQSLDNRHLGLLELLLSITASSVREIDGVVDLDVIVKGDVFYFDSETGLEPSKYNWSNFRDVPMSLPFPKELNLLAKPRDVFW